ncbi:AAA family ATPase [Streptomyces sp. NPDC002659]|uniref:helix-turn-helix transcriptional regulator n=1 Tax=Streptomyces sp. NPDC002659 TaxID=3364656 RepID=UPI003675EB25
MRIRLDLLEREAESGAVAEAMQDLTQGGGGLLLVEGPAGIGKSRLLAQVRAAALEAGASVVWARGTQLEREFAFGVVRQLFEPLLADADTAERETLWSGPAAQARRVFAPADPATEPAGDFAVLHGLYWLTANAGADIPRVLLLDDLQWCDAPSLRYLAYLLPRIENLAVLVAAALRTGESATDERLVQQITTDPAGQVLRPRPLSARATALLLDQALSTGVDPSFAAACHAATGGNPLLLCELARTIAAEGIEASAANAALVRGLGARAVARLVAARTARLPDSSIAIARAVAVLGDHAELTHVAALAGQQPDTALTQVAALERLDILRAEQDHTGVRLAFIHPLVQAAVHDSIDLADRTTNHRRAAQLLTMADADSERVAAHLLHTPPAGDPHTVTALRAAAAGAAGRGAPEGAYTYLRRALTEPPTEAQHLQVLTEAGHAALLVDVEAAVVHLQQALDQTTDPVARADIAARLGTAHVYLLDADRGLAIWDEALLLLPADQEERKRRLEAGLLTMATWVVPGQNEVLGRVPDLRRLRPHDSIGGRLLDCAIAGRNGALCDPTAVSRASRALADGTLIAQTAGDASVMGGWNALLTADDEHIVMDSLNTAVEHAHLHGSLYALTPAYTMRALGWLWRGRLTQAEHDARESVRLAELAGIGVGNFFAGVSLTEALTEQGRLNEAEQALQTIGVTAARCPPGPAYSALASLARLQSLQGNHQAALDTALHAQQVCQAYDIHNPADVAWRTEAAFALYALKRANDAREIAAEDLRLARQWGAPRALGRALRTAGLVQGGPKGLALLEEAVGVLENSPACLEHAKALTDYGAALHRSGHSTTARRPLRHALDLATRCSATPVVEQARTELTAAGGRPRHTAITGPDALTPSEKRVADLAADGATNRQIAQTLFVTPKTVEVHLSSVYRKLGITTRNQLPTALTAPGGGGPW